MPGVKKAQSVWLFGGSAFTNTTAQAEAGPKLVRQRGHFPGSQQLAVRQFIRWKLAFTVRWGRIKRRFPGVEDEHQAVKCERGHRRCNRSDLPHQIEY